MSEAYQLTLFAEDSLAKTSPLPGEAQALMVNVADYGQNTPDLLASFDRDSYLWRTSQHCLVEGLTEFSETWPRSGMMRNGTAYRLPPLVRLTEGTESGLWRTPQAGDSERGITRDKDKLEKRLSNGGQLSLTTQIVHPHLWPTPTVSGNYNRKGASKTSGDGLATAVKMWPTPTAHNSKEGVYPAEYLRNTPTPAAVAGGRLNPTWVEWLMGFPAGHTDLNN